ncbi:MAG: hypothetical protein OXC69_08390 [Candidatus Tectomicrobia bacterium]|nr:hypothetical protein [Candidatus Tectomicrobia bacterium]
MHALRPRQVPHPPGVELQVVNGQDLVSLYTGRVLGNRSESDIEYPVAIAEAYHSGLCAAAAETRRRFARNLDNLTLAVPRLNRYRRLDRATGRWLPA